MFPTTLLAPVAAKGSPGAPPMLPPLEIALKKNSHKQCIPCIIGSHCTTVDHCSKIPPHTGLIIVWLGCYFTRSPILSSPGAMGPHSTIYAWCQKGTGWRSSLDNICSLTPYQAPVCPMGLLKSVPVKLLGRRLEYSRCLLFCSFQYLLRPWFYPPHYLSLAIHQDSVLAEYRTLYAGE